MIAQRPIDRTVPPTHVMGVARFERFFRAAAGLDVDKEDLKRYADFVNRKIYDLLIRGEAVAKANGRDLIQPIDLPITEGMQESIHRFKEIDETIELRPILDRLTARPPLDLELSEETEAELSAVGGGLSIPILISRTRKPGIGSVRSRSSTCCCRVERCSSHRCAGLSNCFRPGADSDGLISPEACIATDGVRVWVYRDRP